MTIDQIQSVAFIVFGILLLNISRQQRRIFSILKLMRGSIVRNTGRIGQLSRPTLRNRELMKLGRDIQKGEVSGAVKTTENV